jgi:flagellar M-ring protein FliF
MLTQLKEYLKKMSRGSKIRLAILSGFIVALAIVTVSLLNRTTYVTMYSAQDPAEAGDIYAALQDMNIPVKIEGTRILVPEDRVSELQAAMASQGIIGASNGDFSIMQGAAGFSVTESHANKLYELQRASDIRAAILTSPKIQNANVVVNFGEASPFARPANAKQPTCSVTLTLMSGATLTNQEAQTIAESVKTAVQGISYENISITDNNLNYYKIGDEVIDIDSELSFRVTLQNRLAEQIQVAGEQLVAPIFGMGNIKVTPTVRLNFDKVVTESVEFQPPVAGEIDGVVRSSSDLWEAQRKDNAAEGIPGTDTNAMGTAEYPYGSLNNNDQYGRTLREKNYEINETRTKIEQEQGKIEYLSVAVLINSDATEEDYTEEVANLVSAGLGIDLMNVKVERIPFAVDTSAGEAIKAREAYEAQIKQRELIQMIIRWSVILLLGLALIWLIRTIVKAVNPAPEPEPVLVEAGAGAGAVPDIGIDYIADDEEDIVDVTENEEIELQKKYSGLEQIEKFIEKDPAAVAQLLRNWLTEG